MLCLCSTAVWGYSQPLSDKFHKSFLRSTRFRLKNSVAEGIVHKLVTWLLPYKSLILLCPAVKTRAQVESSSCKYDYKATAICFCKIFISITVFCSQWRVQESVVQNRITWFLPYKSLLLLCPAVKTRVQVESSPCKYDYKATEICFVRSSSVTPCFVRNEEFRKVLCKTV